MVLGFNVRLIFGPFLKLKKLSCADEAFRIILPQRHLIILPQGQNFPLLN